MEKTFTAQRQNWIDSVKGLSILLVMWGHIQSETWASIWVYSFHVPVFFVISGILLRNKDVNINMFL